VKINGINIAESLSTALIASAITLLFLATPALGTDVPNSKDNPIVSRFAGSAIVGYQQSAFDEVQLPIGPLRNAVFDKTYPSKGKVTRIAYAAPDGKTSAEVLANFQNALQGHGFKLLYTCASGSDGCGGFNFSQKYAEGILSGDPSHYNAMIGVLYSTNDDVRYLLAELQRGTAKVDVGLMVAKNNDNPAGVLLQIVESGDMPTDQVTVDSAAMEKGLRTDGKIALYGLHFATDSANLEPDSEQTLKQMSDLLHKEPTLKVYIVGHTDNTGTLAHNLALSQARADAVIKVLVSHYGIAPARLSAKGLASYSPVASNRDDAGKAKNRRVEMVEQ